MKINLRKNIVIGVCTAAILSPQVALFAGSSPQDATQLTDMEEMTDKEIQFADLLTGDAVEAYIEMSHNERAMAMKMVESSGNGKDISNISANDAVMSVWKKRQVSQ